MKPQWPLPGPGGLLRVEEGKMLSSRSSLLPPSLMQLGALLVVWLLVGAVWFCPQANTHGALTRSPKHQVNERSAMKGPEQHPPPHQTGLHPMGIHPPTISHLTMEGQYLGYCTDPGFAHSSRTMREYGQTAAMFTIWTKLEPKASLASWSGESALSSF